MLQTSTCVKCVFVSVHLQKAVKLLLLIEDGQSNV